jgi:hypothetical protein
VERDFRLSHGVVATAVARSMKLRLPSMMNLLLGSESHTGEV